ncbi:MAG: hypothetical protein HY060_22990 [Proteobacteria bacterium]|nr:hypothetical protein [Pseudomonadota bacterium]
MANAVGGKVETAAVRRRQIADVAPFALAGPDEYPVRPPTIGPVRVGQLGFGFVPTSRGFERVPQFDRAVFPDDVDIGANSTIDRGAAEDTVIGAGCVIDNLVQIEQNGTLGQGCIIVAQAGIAGNSILEDHVVVGGQAGLSDHVRVDQGAKVAAQGGVMRGIDPGAEAGGAPAVPIRQWHRQPPALARLAKRKGD